MDLTSSASVDKRTGHVVAIKIVEIEAGNDDVRDIIEEISILAGLSSPYVTKYYGSYLKGSDLWIIMEFCSGGSCSDLMRPGDIAEDYIMIIVKELLLGLEYLHNDKKLHRDIKGEDTRASHRRYCVKLTHHSCKHSARRDWSSQACRLWRLVTTHCDHDKKEHLCWDSFLDGSRSDQAGRSRP